MIPTLFCLLGCALATDRPAQQSTHLLAHCAKLLLRL